MLIICLRSPTCQAMSAYQEMVAHGPDDPICWGKKGPLTYRGMYHLFKRLAEKAGISDAIFNPHTWQHAFGRDTTIAGIPTAQLQDLMVHSTMEVTKAYARFNTAELQEAHAPYSPVEEDLKEIQLELQHKNQATSSHTSHDS